MDIHSVMVPAKKDVRRYGEIVVDEIYDTWDGHTKKSPQILCNLTVDRLPKICQNVITKEVNVLRRKQYETFYR